MSQAVTCIQPINRIFSLYRYAIMCGIMAEYETVQNKIKNGYIFKVSCLTTTVLSFSETYCD